MCPFPLMLGSDVARLVLGCVGAAPGLSQTPHAALPPSPARRCVLIVPSSSEHRCSGLLLVNAPSLRTGSYAPGRSCGHGVQCGRRWQGSVVQGRAGDAHSVIEAQKSFGNAAAAFPPRSSEGLPTNRTRAPTQRWTAIATRLHTAAGRETGRCLTEHLSRASASGIRRAGAPPYCSDVCADHTHADACPKPESLRSEAKGAPSPYFHNFRMAPHASWLRRLWSMSICMSRSLTCLLEYIIMASPILLITSQNLAVLRRLFLPCPGTTSLSLDSGRRDAPDAGTQAA